MMSILSQSKKVFVNLEEEPFYLNKGKGLTIKNVAIYEVSNALALQDKKDHLGKIILDKISIKSVNNLNGISKIRINHLGLICHIGE